MTLKKRTRGEILTSLFMDVYINVHKHVSLFSQNRSIFHNVNDNRYIYSSLMHYSKFLLTLIRLLWGNNHKYREGKAMWCP